MSASALQLRRARRAIYGPPSIAFIGLALIAAGAAGLIAHATHSSTATVAEPPQTGLAPPAAEVLPSYVVVGAHGALSSGSTITLPRGATVVGAAPAPTRGYWIATSDGNVFGIGVATRGAHRVKAGEPPIVGIAASPSGGYWLASADGRVYAFGAPRRGDFGGWPVGSPIVGIAASPDGGYWLAHADGSINAFGTRTRGQVKGYVNPKEPIVGIAATGTGGYWLASADGHVYGLGARVLGDTFGLELRSPIVAITAIPGGGYWTVSADGRVYQFGGRAQPVRAAASVGRAVALVAQ